MRLLSDFIIAKFLMGSPSVSYLLIAEEQILPLSNLLDYETKENPPP